MGIHTSPVRMHWAQHLDRRVSVVVGQTGKGIQKKGVNANHIFIGSQLYSLQLCLDYQAHMRALVNDSDSLT